MAYKNICCIKDEAYDESYIEPQCTIGHIKEWNVGSIKADAQRCGLSGSPTKVKKIENIVLTAGDVKQVQNTDEGIVALIQELTKEHIIG